MNKLTTDKRVTVVKALCEGVSIRGTVRLTGVAKNTVVKLLVDLGCACTDHQDKTLRNLTCDRIQIDEIWSFVGAKQKSVDAGKNGLGDVWTWTAIDADTKLVPSWLVGDRDGETAKVFINDLADRVRHRVQLTSYGHSPYLRAVSDAFGMTIDYAILVKYYGTPTVEEQRKDSPAKCTGCEKHIVIGQPAPEHISTSYVERQNLSMRMRMRRFTRLTNGFSKKLSKHCHAVALYFMHYNFARVHHTLRCTPAMKAGVADHFWSVEEIVGLLDIPAKSSN